MIPNNTAFPVLSKPCPQKPKKDTFFSGTDISLRHCYLRARKFAIILLLTWKLEMLHWSDLIYEARVTAQSPSPLFSLLIQLSHASQWKLSFFTYLFHWGGGVKIYVYIYILDLLFKLITFTALTFFFYEVSIWYLTVPVKMHSLVSPTCCSMYLNC